MMEAILLGLRTAAGIDVMGFKRRFGVDFIEVFGAAVSDLASQGLLRLTAERCAATRRGMLYLDSVTAALTAQELQEATPFEVFGCPPP